jgi:hypothetical protein
VTYAGLSSLGFESHSVLGCLQFCHSVRSRDDPIVQVRSYKLHIAIVRGKIQGSRHIYRKCSVRISPETRSITTLFSSHIPPPTELTGLIPRAGPGECLLVHYSPIILPTGPTQSDSTASHNILRNEVRDIYTNSVALSPQANYTD